MPADYGRLVVIERAGPSGARRETRWCCYSCEAERRLESLDAWLVRNAGAEAPLGTRLLLRDGSHDYYASIGGSHRLWPPLDYAGESWIVVRPWLRGTANAAGVPGRYKGEYIKVRRHRENGSPGHELTIINSEVIRSIEVDRASFYSIVFSPSDCYVSRWATASEAYAEMLSAHLDFGKQVYELGERGNRASEFYPPINEKVRE